MLNSLDLNDSSTLKVKGTPEYDLNEILGKILGRFIEEPSFSPFLNPITPDLIPDYHLKIMSPICLRQIEEVCLCLVDILLNNFSHSEC